jgi:hypothetical protein
MDNISYNANNIVVGTPKSNEWRNDLMKESLNNIKNLNDYIYISNLDLWLQNYIIKKELNE